MKKREIERQLTALDYQGKVFLKIKEERLTQDGWDKQFGIDQEFLLYIHGNGGMSESVGTVITPRILARLVLENLGKIKRLMSA